MSAEFNVSHKMRNSSSNPEAAPEKPIVRAFLFVETFPYFVLGAFVAISGVIAVSEWCAEQWAQGNFIGVLSVASIGLLLLCAFVFAVRKRRPVIALAVLLAWCGVITYLLGSFGIKFPWFGG